MKKYDSAVSPAIAVILILALTIILAAITGVAVLSNSGINTPAPVLGVTITQKGEEVVFTHYSGETLKAGEYKILLDSKTIDGVTDFGPGSVLTYNAPNLNHAALVYSKNGNNAIIAEKYFGGSGLPIYKVDVDIIGFRTSSILSVDRKTEETDGKKYELVYDTESKKGVIIKLTGEYAGDVSSLTDVVIKGAEVSELPKKDNEYFYSIPVEEESKIYEVSGRINFYDGTSQLFNSEVYIPAEAELTFEIGTYAKYKDGVFKSGTNMYAGHGIYIKLTGGSRVSDVLEITSISLTAVSEKEGVGEKTFSTDSSSDKYYKLILDASNSDKIDGVYLNKKLYYYINSESENNRYALDISSINVKIGLENEPKSITINPPDNSFITKHIYAWTPLYENIWYSQPDEKEKPFSVNIEPYVSDEYPQNGFKITVSDGDFPDINYADKRIGSDKIFPVELNVKLNNGETVVPLQNTDDLSSIGNYEYYFIIDNSYSGGGDIKNAKVTAEFKMTDEHSSNNNNKEKSFTVEKSIDIPKVSVSESPIKVNIEGYQKLIADYSISGKFNSGDRGHGLKITAEKIDGVTLKAGSEYYLKIDEFKKGDKSYVLVKEYGTDSTLVPENSLIEGSSGRVVNINNQNYLKITDAGKLLTTYLYIAKTDNEVNNVAFDNQALEISLFELNADGKLLYIGGDSYTLGIPARDILVKDVSIKGYTEEDKKGIRISTSVDLSSIVNPISITLKYNSYEITGELKKSGNLWTYDFIIPDDVVGDGNATVSVRINKDRTGYNIPIYSSLTGSGLTTPSKWI